MEDGEEGQGRSERKQNYEKSKPGQPTLDQGSWSMLLCMYVLLPRGGLRLEWVKSTPARREE